MENTLDTFYSQLDEHLLESHGTSDRLVYQFLGDGRQGRRLGRNGRVLQLRFAGQT